MYSYLPIQKKKKKTRLGIVTHTANPASQEAETISDWGQPGKTTRPYLKNKLKGKGSSGGTLAWQAQGRVQTQVLKN